MWKRVLVLAGCFLAVAADAFPQPNNSLRIDFYGDPLPPGAVARLGTLRFRHAGWLAGVAFSPDGKTLACVGSDGIRVWEAPSGKPWRLPSEATPGTHTAVFSPDGTTVATLADDKIIRLWDVATGREIRKFAGHQGWIDSMALSRDGKSLASAGGGIVRLWDVSSANEVRRLEGHADQINNPAGSIQILEMAFSPDGKILASTCFQDKKILLWDVAKGQILRSLADQDRARAVAFSPDGKTLASSDNDRRIRLWEVATGRVIHRLEGHQGEVYTVGFSPDGKFLASGASGSPPLTKEPVDTDPTIRLWELETGKGRPLPGPCRWAKSVAFSADGKFLAAGGGGTTITLLDLATGKELQPQGGHDGGVRCVALSPDQKTLASGGDDNLIHLWDLSTSRETFRMAGHKGHVTGLAFAPDGKTLSSAGLDGGVHLWDPAAGKQIRRLAEDSGWHQTLALSPDGKTLALSDGRLLDISTGKVNSQYAKQLAGNHLCFSPDGKTLGIAGGIVARLCDLATGKELCRFAGHEEPPDQWERQAGGIYVACIAFSPDGATVASGGSDHLIFLWDAATGKLLRRLEGHKNLVTDVAFSPDGRTVASASGSHRNHKDQTVRLWEVATGKERRRFAGHYAQVTSLVFSADGKTIISGSEDGAALVWDVTGRKSSQRKLDPLAAPELEKLWNVLAAEDAAKGHEAIWTLFGDPRSAVPFLADRLRPVAEANAQQIARLIAGLDSAGFGLRDKATRELEGWAELAGPALRHALATASSQETRRRLENLLAKLDQPVGPGKTLQALRAIEVLENIGTPQARQTLAALATGASEAWVTRQAKASLARTRHERPAVP